MALIRLGKNPFPLLRRSKGEPVWDGDVEVFKMNHPKTETACAWSDADGNFTVVLGVPPATDPRKAVKVSIAAAAKKGR